MPPARRYLVPFAPKASAHRFTDVLVVGAGIAGLRAALAVPEPLDVLVVTKDRIAESNSAMRSLVTTRTSRGTGTARAARSPAMPAPTTSTSVKRWADAFGANGTR